MGSSIGSGVGSTVGVGRGWVGVGFGVVFVGVGFGLVFVGVGLVVVGAGFGLVVVGTGFGLVVVVVGTGFGLVVVVVGTGFGALVVVVVGSGAGSSSGSGSVVGVTTGLVVVVVSPRGEVGVTTESGSVVSVVVAELVVALGSSTPRASGFLSTSGPLNTSVLDCGLAVTFWVAAATTLSVDSNFGVSTAPLSRSTPATSGTAMPAAPELWCVCSSCPMCIRVRGKSCGSKCGWFVITVGWSNRLSG